MIWTRVLGVVVAFYAVALALVAGLCLMGDAQPPAPKERDWDGEFQRIIQDVTL